MWVKGCWGELSGWFGGSGGVNKAELEVSTSDDEDAYNLSPVSMT